MYKKQAVDRVRGTRRYQSRALSQESQTGIKQCGSRLCSSSTIATSSTSYFEPGELNKGPFECGGV